MTMVVRLIVDGDIESNSGPYVTEKTGHSS